MIHYVSRLGFRIKLAMVIEEANVEKLAVWCCAHIAADGFAPKSQICDLTC